MFQAALTADNDWSREFAIIINKCLNIKKILIDIQIWGEFCTVMCDGTLNLSDIEELPSSFTFNGNIFTQSGG